MISQGFHGRPPVKWPGNLVLNFLVADFGNSDTDRLAMAKALAAKAAEKIK